MRFIKAKGLVALLFLCLSMPIMADDVITFKQNAIIDTLETMEQKRKNEQVAAKIGERQVETIRREYTFQPK